MANASGSSTPTGYQTSARKEGPLMAIVQVVIGLAIVGGGLFWYRGYVTEKERVSNLIVEAKNAQRGDDAPALLAARGFYEKTGKVEEEDKVLVQMAEVDAQLVFAYGMTDLKDEAAKYTQMAKDRDLKKAERYAAEGYLLLADGQVETAEQMVTDLMKRGIRHAKLLHVLSQAKLAQGKSREAQAAAEEAMKLTTGLVRLPIAHGDALLAQGNYGSAVSSYQKALQLNPNHLMARAAILLTQAIARDGKPKLLMKEADKLLAEAAQATGGTPPPRTAAFLEYIKGEIALSDSDAKGALAHADAAITADPRLAAALSLKARALAGLGKINDAKAAFEAALKAAPTSIIIAQAGFEALSRAGKVKEGVALLEGVKTANPENALIYPALAVAQAKAGMNKESTATAAVAVEKLGNANPDAIFARARALQANGELDKAREAYNEAMQEKGSQLPWPEVFYEMGFIRFGEKDFEGATALFKEAASQWTKAKAPVANIVDGLEAAAKSLESMGDKKSKKEAAEIRDRIAKLKKGGV
jgi:tetratricopeptide (TPR) repeat protein